MGARLVFTSVLGHLTEKDFPETHRAWHSCDPFSLFDAAVETKIASDKVKLKQNLGSQARACQMLVIWTDCDREGEAIGGEIADICRSANRNIQVKRARFSAIISQYDCYEYLGLSDLILLQTNPSCCSASGGPGLCSYQCRRG